MRRVGLSGREIVFGGWTPTFLASLGGDPTKAKAAAKEVIRPFTQRSWCRTPSVRVLDTAQAVCAARVQHRAIDEAAMKPLDDSTTTPACPSHGGTQHRIRRVRRLAFRRWPVLTRRARWVHGDKLWPNGAQLTERWERKLLSITVWCIRLQMQMPLQELADCLGLRLLNCVRTALGTAA
jgi:hypothetical protein